MKRIKYLLLQFDGLWSVPLAFIVFWLVGLLLQAVFGYQTGIYDAAFIQPLFLAGAIVIGATNIAVLGMYFTFRGLYRYLYGQRDKDGTIKNYAKINWLELTVWQRYIAAFSVFFYFVAVTVIVYLHLV